MADGERGSLALPDRARLLHIGLMKTGTTSVQHAASTSRKRLLRHGVRYPGRRYNHRQAALALMNRTDLDRARPDHTEPNHTGPDAWDELMAEVTADSSRRIFLSNEFICGSDDLVAQRFLDDLGPRTHVVITLRSAPAILPSIWQQYVKTGTQVDLETWLRPVLADPVDETALPKYYSRNDQGAVVARWARLAGPDRVTVIVADRANPGRLPAAFEELLSLPAGTLTAGRQTGHTSNRSMTAEEAALFVAVNQIVQPGQMSDDELRRIYRSGAIERVLDVRQPEATDTAVVLPSWAVDPAVRLGERYATIIAETGVRVVGDLAQLAEPPRAGGGRSTLPDLIPVELAAQAVVGAMSAGLHRGSNFGRVRPAIEPSPVSRRDQAKAAAGAMRRRLASVITSVLG